MSRPRPEKPSKRNFFPIPFLKSYFLAVVSLSKNLFIDGLLLHCSRAVAGGLASEALGGNFASGAAAAFASAVAANSGVFDGLNEQQIATLGQLIGGTAGFLASGGRSGDAVNSGASIAESAALNNYLTHAELKKYQEDLEECKRSSACIAELRIVYNQISRQNSAKLAACGTDNICVARHINEIAKANQLAQEINVLRTNRRGGILRSGDAFKVYQESDLREAVATYRTNIDLAAACPGLDSGCVTREKVIIQAKYVGNVALDFTPIVGDIKGFVDAYNSGNSIDWVVAVLGIAPGVGDALGKLVKGGKIDGISKSDFDLLEEVQGLSAAEKNLAYNKYVVSNNVPDVDDSVPYFRVQGGGSGTEVSQERLIVNSDGSVSINPGCSGQLCVSTYSTDHAKYYLTNKRPDGNVVVFDVDRATHNRIIRKAVEQRNNKGASVKITDRSVSGTARSLELDDVHAQFLVDGASNGRVLTQKEFFDEFGSSP